MLKKIRTYFPQLSERGEIKRKYSYNVVD